MGAKSASSAPHQAPLITSAGRDHVLLSKQLCVVLVVGILCGVALFFQAQQAAVQKAMLSSQAVADKNKALKMKNEELIAAKAQVNKDEEELAAMYEKWLAEDNEDLKLTKQQIADMQAKLSSVKEAQQTNGEVLAHKEILLAEKEDVLSDLHMQLRAKNTLIKKMKNQIFGLNGTVPAQIDMPSDDDWAW